MNRLLGGKRMSLGNLDNCPVCGQLFVRNIRTVCNNCYKKVEEDFEKVYAFIKKKENRMCTIYEVSDATGVKVTQIRQFIREGRLRLADFPNMGYPCERCGTNLIKTGALCEECKKFIDKEIRISFDDDYRRQELLKKMQAGVGYLSSQNQTNNKN